MTPNPFAWSVRRELWENRSLVVAPLVAAGVLLFGFFVSLFRLPHRMREIAGLDAMKQQSAVIRPFTYVLGLLMVTAFVVGFFYCLDALHGERRDRSILFWKSLPVSDAVAVASKASIPLAVLPALAFAIVFAVQMTMLIVSSAVLLHDPRSLSLFWARLPIVQLWLAQAYTLVVIALWHAPLYAWLLLVSAWAKRAVFVWAVSPLLAFVVFGSRVAGNVLKYVLGGWFERAYVPMEQQCREPLQALTPARLLGSPGLWLGLVLAGLLLAATVRLRRLREPI